MPRRLTHLHNLPGRRPALTFPFMDSSIHMREECRLLARKAVLAHWRGDDLAGLRLLRYMLRRCPRRLSPAPSADACTDAGMLACLDTVSGILAGIGEQPAAARLGR